MQMTWWPQGEALAPLIDAIYVYRCDEPSRTRVAGALLSQVMWQLDGRLAVVGRDRQAQPLHRASAVGPAASALTLDTRGPVTVVGAGLFPEGWSALMPLPAGQAVETVVDLDTLWDEDASLSPRASPACPDAELAQMVRGRLTRRLEHAHPVDPRISVITGWADGTRHDIEELRAALGVSHRHLDRLATAACGLPPRLLANKHRIMRLAAALASGHDTRRDVWTSDYADQSHFNRNFKRFVGVSPTDFLTADDLLVRDVMRVRQCIASSHPLGLGQAETA